MSNVGGRPTVFDGKVRDSQHRFQGWFTPWARKAFEGARQRLKELAGWETSAPSDADVVEYLLRGPSDTRRVLKGKRRT